MADYLLPAGTKYFGSTGGDQVQFIRTGHTAALPRLFIFKRRQANGKPTSEYSVSAVHASQGPDLITRNTLAEFKLRNVVGQDPATIKALVGSLGAMLSNADFQDDCVVELLLPAPNAITP